MKQVRVLQYLVGAIAVVLTMSITGAALAQEDSTVVCYYGLDDSGSFFARGNMSVDLGRYWGELYGPNIELRANGHGSVSFEVYDANDVLLGTVSGPLVFATDDPTPEDLVPIVSVVFQRVADGENVCAQEGQTLTCSIPVVLGTTNLRLVASVRGQIGLASIGYAPTFSAVEFIGNGSGEASFDYSITVATSTGGCPTPQDTIPD